MSKNAKGLLGEQVGKVGPVVARMYRGVNIYSAYQPNVSNPKSAKQKVQRTHFAVMSRLAHNFACGAIFGFRTAVAGTKWSARNLFQKVNWDMITITGDGSASIDYTGILVARGGLSNVSPDVPQFDTPNHVVVDFTDLASPCQRTVNDVVYAYVYCPDAKAGVLSSGAKIAEDTSVSVKVSSLWNGLKAHVWMFTRNEGDPVPAQGIVAGECSDSVYVGSGFLG